MALTTTQQTDLYKLAVGMYAAAPGVVYMNDLANAVNAGVTISQLYGILAGSASFQNQNFAYTGASTNTQFATTFCNKLLGTTVTAANMTLAIDFVSGLLTGGSSRGAAMKTAIDLLISVSATDANFGKAQVQFTNKITVAQYYTETLSGTETDITKLQTIIINVTNDPATVTAAETGATSTAGGTFTLTSAIDNLVGTGGNDTFIGDDKTASSADQVAGGAGTDTLKLYDTVTLPAISGIESIFLSSPDASLDISGLSTVTAFTLDNETMAAALTYTVATGQAITLQNITGATGFELNIAAATSVTSHSITLDKVGTGSSSNFVILDIEGKGVTTLSLTTANNASNLQLKDTGAKLATINVAGDKAVVIDADTNTTVLTKVDASAMTAGGVTITLEDDTTPKDVTFMGGAGNDAVRFGVEFNELDSADGGAGTDTIAIADGADLTTNSGAKIANFETFDIRAGTGTYDLSKVSGITKLLVGDSLTGATTVNNLAEGASAEIGAALAFALTINQKDAGVGSPNDSMTVTLNASSGFTTGTALTIPDIETLTVNSTSSGTSQTHVLSSILAPAATSVLINASTAKLTVASITAVNSVLFDASTSAKAVSLTFAAQSFTTNSGIEVKGGAGNDTISFANVAAFAAGQDSNFATPTYDQIKVTGGKGGDTITVKASIDSDQYTFVTAAGDSVSAVGVTNGVSADATDTVQGIVNNAAYADAAGNRIIFDTEVTATAVTFSTTAVTFGTTAVANAGDFYVFDNNGNTANTAVVYQDTNGNKLIDAGEYAIQLIGNAQFATGEFTISNGNLLLVTT